MFILYSPRAKVKYKKTSLEFLSYFTVKSPVLELISVLFFGEEKLDFINP